MITHNMTREQVPELVEKNKNSKKAKNTEIIK